MSEGNLPAEPTPFERFEDGLRRVLAVTPEELKRREAAWREEQAASRKQKPGPKKRNSLRDAPTNE